jgi:hypothetical protein
LKRVFGLFVLVLFVSSCSFIEKTTEKWKTPVEPDAGLAPGEKSSYLLNKEQAERNNTPKKIKKKAIKKR